MNRYESPQRTIPANLEAEQALLGAMLMNNQAFHAVSSYLIAEDFHEPIHQKIYKGIAHLAMNDRSANPVSVKSLVPDVKIGDMSISQYLSALTSSAVNFVSVKDMASLVLELSLRRSLISVGETMINRGYEADNNESVEAIIEEVEQSVFEISAAHREQNGGGRFAGSSILTQYLEMVTHDPQKRTMHGVPIGLQEVATVLSERVFEPTNVYGMISSSGEGKTSLVLMLVRAAVAAGNPVLFLSYDQSGPQIISQMVAQELGIETRIQRAGNMTQKQQDKAADYVRTLANAAFEVKDCDSSKDTPKRLSRYVKEFIRKNSNGRTPFIVIDHAGTIKPESDDKSADQGTKARNAVQELKSCAKATKASILILMQRSSDGMKRFNPRPAKSDVYGGQSAVQPYDAIYYLYRGQFHMEEQMKTAKDEKERGQIEARFHQMYGTDIEGTAEIGALKVRFGTTSQRRKVRFIPEYTRYESFYQPEYEQGEML